jgi:hypothetical protein
MMKLDKKHILAVILPFGMAACGGGGGSSTPTASSPTVPVASTPDNPVVVKVGPITGFGSVFVDGERFETSSSDTNYLTDDSPADEDDLEIGMIVRVRASSTNDDGEWIADDVEFDENLKGPVDSVGADSFVALGQTINVTAQTRFDDGLTLPDLAMDDIVEVSGYRNEFDEIDATYVERKVLSDVDDFEVLGQVRDLNTTAMTFRIGDLTVDYSGAELDDLGSGLANGVLVEAEDENRAYMGGDLLMLATEVEGEFIGEFKDEDDDDLDGDGIRDDDDEDDDDDRDEFEIKGVVTEVIDSGTFMIGAMEVQHGSGTEYSGGAAADIVAGVRVEVEGDLIGANVISAEEVEFEDNEARISGLVNEVDAEGEQVVVMGVSIDMSRAEEIEDDASDVEPFTLDDLQEGDFVEVEGNEVDNVIFAEELERDEADDSELRGVLDDFDATAQTVTVLGQLISTDEQTQYEIDDVRVSAELFFDRLHIDQSVVDADWSGAQADTLTPARELSLED